jgi:hypothetical protein
MGVNHCPKDPNYQLGAIGHGCMSDDILIATGNTDMQRTGWIQDGIMFLLLNPAKITSIYTEVNCDGYKKYPTHTWYWANSPLMQKYSYPTWFQGLQGSGELFYSAFFTSALYTFKLNKLYITDFIKCGMNKGKKECKTNLADYNKICVNNCLNNYLLPEINFVNPKVIFCFGGEVFKNMQDNYNFIVTKNRQLSFKIKLLPHPAATRTFDIQDFQFLYLTGFANGLYDAKLITKEEKLDWFSVAAKINYVSEAAINYWERNIKLPIDWGMNYGW